MIRINATTPPATIRTTTTIIITMGTIDFSSCSFPVVISEDVVSVAELILAVEETSWLSTVELSATVLSADTVCSLDTFAVVLDVFAAVVLEDVACSSCF